MPGSGYATISRKKILEFLKKNSDRTVAVADIDHYLKAQDCEVNITTIYRYLDKLAKDGTVIKYVAEKGNQAVYQYVELSLIHISEPTRRTPISYAVFCLKKKKKT